jgi:hypothetical protein
MDIATAMDESKAIADIDHDIVVLGNFHRSSKRIHVRKIRNFDCDILRPRPIDIIVKVKITQLHVEIEVRAA